jgi:ribose-phosphate pyrophosphokinase
MIFIQPEYRYLLKSADQVGEYESGMHSQHELFLILHHEVAGKSCHVIGSLAAAPERVLELLLLCHTLKKEGALKVSLVSPYLGYSRQDHNQPLRSYGLKWALDSAAACGVDEIISIDIHNTQFDSIPSLQSNLINISPLALWEPYFYQYAQQGYSFVLPDKGAYNRYEYLHRYIWAYFEKKRNVNDVEIVGMQGKIHQKVVIVDDILDSGKTLLQACIALQKMGVQEIIIFITHGVFSNIIWHEMFALGVKCIYCTNSLPEVMLLQHPCIKIVSIRPLLDEYLL